jgi:hypothetical protein
MNLEEAGLHCQLPCLRFVAEGFAEAPPQSIGRRGKLLIRRHLDPSKERSLKNYTNKCMNRLCRLTGKNGKPSALARCISSARLQDGDLVRVRSRKEIESTLNHWRQVRGCSFMPEMAEYCGTIQRVGRIMTRFVDERDLRIKKSSGIILLDGVMCKGTADFGSCDRSCLHFWREEWLEKLEKEPVSASNASSTAQVAGDFVRVRPLVQIEATLNQNRQLMGCAFMPEMAEYCGTTQRVLKPMRRFVDERDLLVKKASGIILLECVMCKGTFESVTCDRRCHLLWREEWLEEVKKN